MCAPSPVVAARFGIGIVREQRSISADVALRLGKYFGMTPQFWMNLQADYDLRLAAATAPLKKIKPRSAA
jgi:antitoxin HigA-1